MNDDRNIDLTTVEAFGKEWELFDQESVSPIEMKKLFDDYFSLVDWSSLGESPIVMDVGSGSGRWAEFVAPRVEKLLLVDPSSNALNVARRKLESFKNCAFYNVSTESLPGEDESCDLVYSLGVLHHIPNTQSAIGDCVKKLKPGGAFLVYLYYRFDNRAWWFRSLWFLSDILRKVLSRCPFFLKKRLTDIIAIFVYLPLSRLSKALEALGKNVSSMPLSFYRNSSLYTMRTDSLDRFGTRLEHRFSQQEIRRMLENAGLVNIRFRDSEPFWCAIGFRPSQTS
jgi:ubiquinone/menaquinone biosynthesis C-methylase UbiE